MKIGILGTGKVGRALAEGWIAKGHDVVLGSRNPSRASPQRGVVILSQRGAVEAGHAVVLAVPYRAAFHTLRSVGPSRFRGKVLVDATNPLTVANDLAVGFESSGAERIARRVHDAQVVKAFNTVFVEHMQTGRIDGEPISLFIAGDNPTAKETVMELGRDLGFDPVDAGPLRCARYLEPMALQLMILGGGLRPELTLAYRLLRKADSIAFQLLRGAPKP